MSLPVHPLRADQAAGLRARAAGSRLGVVHEPVRDRLVAVVSGKGGVGKTNVAANLAIAAAGLGARVLLVDGDLGLANVDVLLGLAPAHDVLDVLSGERALDDVLIRGPRGVRILPAASARSELAALGEAGVARVLGVIEQAANSHDLVQIDAGAGIGRAVLGLTAGCGRALIVTTPEPTSLADGYALLKVMTRETPEVEAEWLPNVVSGEPEARSVFRRMDRLADRFLGVRPVLRGFIPRDPAVLRAVARQRAVVEAFPASPAARSLAALAEQIWRAAREGRGRVQPMQETGSLESVRAAGEGSHLRVEEGR